MISSLLTLRNAGTASAEFPYPHPVPDIPSPQTPAETTMLVPVQQTPPVDPDVTAESLLALAHQSSANPPTVPYPPTSIPFSTDTPSLDGQWSFPLPGNEGVFDGGSASDLVGDPSGGFNFDMEGLFDQNFAWDFLASASGGWEP